MQLKDYNGMLYSFTDPGSVSSAVNPNTCDSPTAADLAVNPSTGEALCSEHTQFTLPVAAMVLITVLNDGTLIFMAYDNVNAATRPETWRLPEVFLVSTTLGLVAMISSLVMLSWALNSKDEDGVLQSIGLPALQYNQVQTVMYLKISLSDFLSVAAARTVGPFWERKPAAVLAQATVIPLCASTLLARFWPSFLPVLQPISWIMVGFIWAFCLLYFCIQDFVKVMLYKVVNFVTKR
eukprot:SAG31_NODE_591_length_13740_cov_11.032256_4_plen_237_part_00